MVTSFRAFWGCRIGPHMGKMGQEICERLKLWVRYPTFLRKGFVLQFPKFLVWTRLCPPFLGCPFRDYSQQGYASFQPAELGRERGRGSVNEVSPGADSFTHVRHRSMARRLSRHYFLRQKLSKKLMFFKAFENFKNF